jgi:hypothetical protein
MKNLQQKSKSTREKAIVRDLPHFFLSVGWLAEVVRGNRVRHRSLENVWCSRIDLPGWVGSFKDSTVVLCRVLYCGLYSVGLVVRPCGLWPALAHPSIHGHVCKPSFCCPN